MGFGRQASIVMAFDPEGHVLVLRRGPTAPYKPGHWNFPGGYVDPTDTSAQEAGLRELYEEANILLPLSSLKWAFSYCDPSLINVFWARLPYRPAVKSNDNEHDMYAWVFPQRVPNPMLPSIRYIVEQL